jgi:hypothetical protein
LCYPLLPLIIVPLKNRFFSFSTYDGQELLNLAAGALCPNLFPPGQECTLPLNPGQYGSLVGGPLDILFGDLPDALSKHKFKARNEKSFTINVKTV